VLHIGVVGHQGSGRDHRRRTAEAPQETVAPIGEGGAIEGRGEGVGHRGAGG
jgi:hypothetical protein